MSQPASGKPAPPALAVYQQIASAIERQIDAGLFRAGQRIYSIREICQTFGVGDVTAKRALRLLKQRGIVDSVVGSGAFVRQPRTAGSPRSRPRAQGVGLLMLGTNPRAIFQHEIDLVQQELQKLGHPLIYAAAPDLNVLRASVDHLVDAGAGCLLVFPRHGDWAEGPRFLEQARAPRLPMLLLETLSSEEDCIAADIRHATGLLVEHLHSLGHRRIALLSAFAPKIEGFARAVARLADPAVQTHVLRGSSDHQMEMIRLAQQMLELKPRPTAVIACNDRMAEVVVQCSLQAGITVPTGLSVATFDDHPALAAQAAIALTVVRHPGLEIAQEVAHWAHDRLRGQASPARFHRVVTGSLIVRDSTAPPATSTVRKESR
jgi:LacI family transcriptional regulator